MEWTIPKQWENQTCYIFGGGWSLKQVDISPFLGKNIIGVNNSYVLLPSIQFCWFGDYRWYGWNEENITRRRLSSSSPIEFVSCHARFTKHPVVKCVRRRGNSGISSTQGEVCWNFCSGFSAINFAYHLGVKTIILVGFDMRPNPNKGEGNNWHKEHQTAKTISERTALHNPYPLFLKATNVIKRDADSLGLTILNATEGSAIPNEVFEHITIKRALEL